MRDRQVKIAVASLLPAFSLLTLEDDVSHLTDVCTRVGFFYLHDTEAPQFEVGESR